jgi:hypothetical protein
MAEARIDRLDADLLMPSATTRPMPFADRRRAINNRRDKIGRAPEPERPEPEPQRLANGWHHNVAVMADALFARALVGDACDCVL